MSIGAALWMAWSYVVLVAWLMVDVFRRHEPRDPDSEEMP